MAYEFRIKVAERELAHFQEMQPLFRAHQEAHDASISALDTLTERIETNLEKLSAAQVVTEQRLQSLNAAQFVTE